MGDGGRKGREGSWKATNRISRAIFISIPISPLTHTHTHTHDPCPYPPPAPAPPNNTPTPTSNPPPPIPLIHNMRAIAALLRPARGADVPAAVGAPEQHAAVVLVADVAFGRVDGDCGEGFVEGGGGGGCRLGCWGLAGRRGWVVRMRVWAWAWACGVGSGGFWWRRWGWGGD